MLRFMDSFDHYGSAERLLKYDFINNSGLVPTAAVGRNGTSGGQSVAQNGGFNTAGIVLDNQATWIVGVAFTPNAFPSAQTSLVKFRDGGQAGTEQFSVELTTAGLFAVARGGTIIATSAAAITPGLSVHFQIKVVINNTGSYELRVNSVNVLSNGSVDTQQSGNAFANTVELGKDAGSGVYDFDDYWVCDGVDSGVSGAPNNDFLGDIRIQYRAPSGNGNSSGMVGSDGNSTDNYLLVDEAAPNGDTDYVIGDSVGDKDTYAMADLTPTAGTVYGVQVMSYAKKSDAGARSIANVVRSAGVEEDSSNYSLTTDYDYYRDVREDDPSAAQWTISSVNGMEVGTKVTV